VGVADGETYTGPEIPVIRITAKAAEPALWPATLIGVPALVALLAGDGQVKRVGSLALVYLAYLWFTGRWPAEGTTPAEYFGGRRAAAAGP
jgi:hypothetical protein